MSLQNTYISGYLHASPYSHRPKVLKLWQSSPMSGILVLRYWETSWEKSHCFLGQSGCPGPSELSFSGWIFSPQWGSSRDSSVEFLTPLVAVFSSTAFSSSFSVMHQRYRQSLAERGSRATRGRCLFWPDIREDKLVIQNITSCKNFMKINKERETYE